GVRAGEQPPQRDQRRDEVQAGGDGEQGGVDLRVHQSSFRFSGRASWPAPRLPTARASALDRSVAGGGASAPVWTPAWSWPRDAAAGSSSSSLFSKALTTWRSNRPSWAIVL